MFSSVNHQATSGVDPTVDERTTKKHRRLDDEPPDSGGNEPMDNMASNTKVAKASKGKFVSTPRRPLEGVGHPKFILVIFQYLGDFILNIVCFVEPRISGRKADAFIASIGFPYSHRVEANGFSGGIWICCPNASKRRSLWPQLRNVASTIDSPWIIPGDFNATVSTAERKGCASSAKSSNDFQTFIFDMGLRDMGFHGPEFTWTRGLQHACSDRILCNNEWDQAFPTSNVSSNKRISLEWLKITGFSLEAFPNRLLNLLKLLPLGISCVQKALACRYSNHLLKLEVDLLLDIERLLDQEELLWRQRSRVDWINMGDQTLKAEAVNYFQSIYASDPPIQGNFPCTGLFPHLPTAMLQNLGDLPSDEEIYSALLDMAPLKALGHDGLHAEFFQRQWPIVKVAVCHMICNVFEGNPIDLGINKKVLVLIPKKDNPESFVDFRPISLCTIMYKLITKVIVQRQIHIAASCPSTNQLYYWQYLGAPVKHKRATYQDYSFILDMMRNKLNGWTSKLLSTAGHVTLDKAVLAAIPIFFMQTTMFPRRVYNEMEKIIRHFICGSSNMGFL
ncbi:uncharacterized protein LOC120169347 [Hibiscus syriacus]|uniref:uncharacterized protein LOC120169347 n=1 Tax=Hibiscus syriacus TaxID=106335 RepID=UPI00192467EC|nr:uncharacterized protein LOC120169347 [Hibiscus syriacus]